MGKVIKPDGEQTLVYPVNGTHFELEEVQAAVGGFVAPLYLDTRDIMYVDEDGLEKHLSFNDKASRIAGQVIVGNVLIVSEQEDMA